MSPSIQKIVIGSYLEEDLVRRIEQTVPSATVVYEPAMLPVPRYRCDHSAPRRELPREDLERWRGLVKDADVYFDFDWLDAPGMPMNSPRLMWIQATSAGMGSYLERTGLQQSDIIVTTAAGIHAVPLSEYALMGVLHFVKGVPLLSRWKAQHHWERYTTGQLAGRRALVIGLGGIGRRVAATFS
jgi:glyoxylate/hydroxypyruvate reductase A